MKRSLEASMAGEAPEFGEILKTLSGAPSLGPAEDTGALQVGWPQTPVPSCKALRPSGATPSGWLT